MIFFILNFFKPDAERNGNTLTASCKLSDPELLIHTDKEKVYAVLTNLIKNALKFTKNGTIQLGCFRKNNLYQFYVKDTGIGVPPEQRELIFDRFSQSTISKKGAYEGTGLGLSISKAYVELLGGRIWVESNSSGSGSVFYFTLPV